MKSFFKKNKKLLGLALLAGLFLATPALADRTSNWWDRNGNALAPNFGGATLQVPGTPGGAGCLEIDGSGNITSSGTLCSSLGGMAIGDPIGGSTPTEVLYTGLTGDLESDSGFTRDPGNNFLTTIQQSNGTGINGSLTGTGGSWSVRTDDTGPSGNMGRLDVNSSFVRILGIFGTGETGVMSASGNENRSSWSDATSSIFSTSVQDVNQSILEWTGAGVDSQFQAASNRARVQFDNGAGLVSNGIFDANAYTIKWDGGAGTTATHYGNSFGSNSVWSDGTAQSLVNAGSTQTYGEYSDGVGNTANTIWNVTGYRNKFSDENLYISQHYGLSDQVFQSYETPYQLIYNNSSGPMTIGEEVSGNSSGATADVFVDNTTYFIVGNVVGNFSSGETITGGTSGNTADILSSIGVWEAYDGIAQNVDVTTLPTRYSLFRNDTALGIDRYEIKHPNSAYFDTPSILGPASIGLSTSVNSAKTHSLTNSSNGNGAYVNLSLNASGGQFNLQQIGSGYTTDGLIIGNRSRILANSGEGLLYEVGTDDPHIFTTQGHTAATEKMRINTAGVGISGSATTKMTNPTAYLQIASGDAAASMAPLKLTPASAQLLTTPEEGAVEVLSDKIYYTISTGDARKEITLNDSALTPGVTPIVTTNGRLTDGPTLPSVVTSGTFTPTPTGVTNITAVTANGGNYTRVGNQVTGSFQIIVDPTTTLTFTEYRVALPVASNFSASNQAGGVCQSGNGNEAEQILSDGTNDTFLVWATPVVVTSQTYSCSYSYTVI